LQVAFDFSHAVDRYGCEVMDRLHGDQANEQREGKHARSAVKCGDWLLLVNEENVSDEETVKIKKRIDD